jgi:hypothetical protein
LVKSEGMICAAFVTEKKQYFDAAIGSLVEGLSDEERRGLVGLCVVCGYGC